MRAAPVRNLRAGLALLGSARVMPERFVRSFDQILLLLLIALSTWAGLDRLHAPAGAQLQLDGLFGWAAYLLTGLCGVALVARLQGRDADTRALLIPALAAAPFLLILLWLVSDLPAVRARPVLAVSASLVYLVYVVLRVLRAAYGRVRLRVALLAAALVISAPFLLDAYGLDMRLWLPQETDQAQDEDADATEVLFYEQPARIAAEVARVTPAAPGHPGVYFLGFAGVGEQAVFKREALFAAQVFGHRLGSAERSVQLINDDADRDSYPLATVSGLDQAVRLLASKMNTDQDVLVLMLTSHGSQDGLEVSNGAVPLRQLAPDDLQEVLDDSAIKWRIVVVSACYSGVFLDSLKNDTTLVITAADSEHSSFGCDDSRELTWFGEAFLRDSLPGSVSFEAAFAKAASLVRAREDAAHQSHSNPQFFMGAAIRRKLAGLPAESMAPLGGTAAAVSATIHGCPKQNAFPLRVPCRLRL